MPNKGSGKPDYGEPWKFEMSNYQVFISLNRKPGEDYGVCMMDGPSTRERINQGTRIVACVNACAGLTDEELKRVRAVNGMYEALKSISGLWPEPPNCADIMAVNGVNDGKSRAIIADAAIKIARKALALADGREPERGER